MPLSPVDRESFTLAVLPDTQQYANRDPDGFIAMTQWIVDHRDEQRIVFCSHVGDVVRRFDSSEEWAVAQAAMSRLDATVPYAISVGNKDMDEESGDASWFCETFPPRRFSAFGWYGGHCRENADSFQTFEAGGHRFLILHLECNAPDDVLAWADRVMTEHPDHRVIVTTHMFLGPLDKPRGKDGYFSDPRGVARWSKCHGLAGNSPQQMWDKCLSRHGNLFLILCGDQSRVQTMHVELTGVRHNRVHVCLCDYYGAPEGWLRLLRFSPAQHHLDVVTYGAISQALCEGTRLVPDRRLHQFTLELPF
jgi:hypothetical protein